MIPERCPSCKSYKPTLTKTEFDYDGRLETYTCPRCGTRFEVMYTAVDKTVVEDP